MLGKFESHAEASFRPVLSDRLACSNLVRYEQKLVPSSIQTCYTGGQATQSKRQSWSFAKAAVDDVQCSGDLQMVFRATSPTLIFAMEEVGGRMQMTEKDGTETGARPGRGGSLTFLPAGSSVIGQARPIKFLRRFVIEFDPAEFARVSKGSSRSNDLLLPHLMASDQRVEEVCKLLAEECYESVSSSNMYSDSLVVALMVKLSRWKRNPVEHVARGGLAPWQLRRSLAYMVEHISEPISLQLLADLSGISLTHYSRAFKSSTGASPYQWIIASRIEKAKTYLLEQALPIAEISIALGFCDQAHLTRTFTKMVGATPSTWRRSRQT